MGTRRKARESALKMLFAADVCRVPVEELTRDFWENLSDDQTEPSIKDFASNLVIGTLRELETVDEKIRSRAEHWRIPRMAIVDRNILRLAVYEFLFEPTPHTVVINEALEIARRFSTYEATQFINGILDAIKQDLGTDTKPEEPTAENQNELSKTSTS